MSGLGEDLLLKEIKTHICPIGTTEIRSVLLIIHALLCDVKEVKVLYLRHLIR